MAQQADLTAILAALGHGRPSTGTPTQGTPTAGYPGVVSAATPANAMAGMALPQPTNSGNLDLSSIKPVNSGSVSLADAIAKARGIAAEKASSRDDPRQRSYRRSRSRSPPRRDNYRDNYNPFRDERRDGRAAGGRDRSVSPPMNQTFSPTRASQTRTRSPPAAKAESNSEIITVQSSSVGLIIGRGGENLRRVESETGARVQFITGPEGSGPLRQCRISGTPRQRADAKKDIYKTVEEHPTAAPEKQPVVQPQPNYYGYSANGPAVAVPADDVEQGSQIMVPDRTVGLIIGRGGETIRDIQERSGCHVNITSESKSVGGFRPVNLMGNRQTTEEARRLIMEVVDSDTRAGPPAMAMPAYSPHPPAPQYAQPQYGMPYDAYGGGPPALSPAPAVGGYDPSGGARATDTIIVPSEAVGMIIGKGGETIKEMQNISACKINVAPPSGPDINREIGLIGSRSAIDAAKRAIWDKVNAVREKQGGVWTRGGEVSQPPPQYTDPYGGQPAPYGQPQPLPSSIPPPDQADPYAPYGGYHAYMAMWAAYGGQQSTGH